MNSEKTLSDVVSAEAEARKEAGLDVGSEDDDLRPLYNNATISKTVCSNRSRNQTGWKSDRRYGGCQSALCWLSCVTTCCQSTVSARFLAVIYFLKKHISLSVKVASNKEGCQSSTPQADLVHNTTSKPQGAGSEGGYGNHNQLVE